MPATRIEQLLASDLVGQGIFSRALCDAQRLSLPETLDACIAREVAEHVYALSLTPDLAPLLGTAAGRALTHIVDRERADRTGNSTLDHMVRGLLVKMVVSQSNPAPRLLKAHMSEGNAALMTEAYVGPARSPMESMLAHAHRVDPICMVIAASTSWQRSADGLALPPFTTISHIGGVEIHGALVVVYSGLLSRLLAKGIGHNVLLAPPASWREHIVGSRSLAGAASTIRPARPASLPAPAVPLSPFRTPPTPERQYPASRTPVFHPPGLEDRPPASSRPGGALSSSPRPFRPRS